MTVRRVPGSHPDVRASWGRRWRLLTAGLLLATLVLPISCHEKRGWEDGKRVSQGMEGVFTWDVLDERDGGSLGVLAFLFLPALAGLAAVMVEKRSLSVRGTTLLFASGLPILIALFEGRELLTELGAPAEWQLLGMVLSALLLGGVLAALREPWWGKGYQAAGIAGVAMLALQLIPVYPAFGRRGETANSITNLLAVLGSDDKRLPSLLKPTMLLTFALGVAIAVYAAALLVPKMRQAWHAQRLLWLNLSVFAFVLFLVPVLLLSTGEREVSWIPLLVMLFALIVAKLLALVGLLTFGTADLLAASRSQAGSAAALHRVEEPDAEPAFLEHARAIQRDHRAVTAGSLSAADFQTQKVAHLKSAARDAVHRGRQDALLELAKKLEGLGALHATEVASLEAFLTRTP